MSSLSNKIDFAVDSPGNHANPNGDPLNGNRPRTDYNGLGEITDVCLKRKLRDRLQECGAAIFVQSDDRKNDDATSLQDRAVKGLGKDFGGPETAKKASEKWLDVRAFGQLFAMKIFEVRRRLIRKTIAPGHRRLYSHPWPRHGSVRLQRCAGRCHQHADHEECLGRGRRHQAWFGHDGDEAPR